MTDNNIDIEPTTIVFKKKSSNKNKCITNNIVTIPTNTDNQVESNLNINSKKSSTVEHSSFNDHTIANNVSNKSNTINNNSEIIGLHEKSISDSDSEFEGSDDTSPLNIKPKSSNNIQPKKRIRTDNINTISSKSIKSASQLLIESETKERELQSQFESIREANKNNVTMVMDEFDALGNKIISIKKGEDENKPKWKQPMKLTSNVRVMSIMDYKPDVCKDYKETSICGWGDTCKYLHDRTNYKQSWQLDKEWEQQQKNKLNKNDSDQVNTNNNELPSTCAICNKSFDRPVKTKCCHYFCESCALKNYVTNTKCFICKKETNGIFSTAFEIIAKQKKRKIDHQQLDSTADENSTVTDNTK